jgi:sec-independent protein translocase protein TatC
MEKKKTEPMSFLDHLEELRFRVIKCLLSVLIFSIAAYIFSDQIYSILQMPLYRAVPDIKLHYFRVTEGFTVRVKMSLLAGLILSVPVILYQIWQFVVPGLYEREKKLVVPVVFAGSLFFLLGALFCFFIVLPRAIAFLSSVAFKGLEPTWMIQEYFSFMMQLVLAFGATFELPILCFFLGRLGIIDSRLMAKGRRYALVAIAILAAAVTPGPDVFSQVVLALPVYLLYELSILIVKLTGKRAVEAA